MIDLLVDTDVFSYLFKSDPRAGPYVTRLEGNGVYLSFASVAELYRWAVSRRWGQARIDDLLQAIAAYELLTYDDQIAWHWAHIMSIPGHPIAAGDAWIAATALRHGMALVTHNPTHFQHISGLSLISE